MVKEKTLEKIDESKLPFFYKLILKIPLPSLDSMSDTFQGLFWAIFAPVSVVAAFFTSLLLLTCLPSPFNIAAVLLVPSVFTLAFLRVHVERFIQGWNALIDTSTKEKDVEKLMNEYLEILKEQDQAYQKER